MTEIKMEPGTLSLPPPPTFAGAPGQQQYDPNASNGGVPTSHMPPPPLPPVVIPQNNNPLPTSVSSPGNTSVTPASSTGGVVRRAAPEPNKRALYVGGLDPRVTEDILRQIFETTGHVTNVKIIPDKTGGAVGFNFHSLLDETNQHRASAKLTPSDLACSIYPHNLISSNPYFLCDLFYACTDSYPRTRIKASTTVSLITTIQALLKGPCKHSTVAVYITR